MAPNTKRAISYLLIGLVIALPLFLFLGQLPIRVYDESRLAFNALEMAESSNWLVTTCNHEPDLWNTKPPLMIWLQALGIKLLGLTEWALRLPSALAALATCFLLFFFSRRALGAPAIGIVAALILVGTKGYVTEHGTRTGDYDALLILFTTLACFSWFAWTEQGNKRNLWLFFIAITLGALTKGIAAMLLMPGLAIYTLYRKKLLLVLRTPAFYLGTLLFVVVVGGYYGLREYASAGYLQAIADNELGGRFLETLEEHKHGFWYYFEGMYLLKFSFGLPMVILSLALVRFVQDAMHRRLIVYLSLVSLVFLLVISSAQTKLNWYDMPVYPLLALQIAIFVYDVVYLQLATRIASKKPKLRWVPLLGIGLYLLVPYGMLLGGIIIKNNQDPQKAMNAAAYYIRGEIERKGVTANTVWVNTEYAPHTEFYLEVARQQGMVITKKELDQVAPGDRVITNGPSIISQLNGNFTITELVNQDGLAVFEVH
ncbi:hypothetical protein BH09BAC1_BH09BAC1_13820 [soil metagenome]